MREEWSRQGEQSDQAEDALRVPDAGSEPAGRQGRAEYRAEFATLSPRGTLIHGQAEVA
jgi:hypothetical protein